VVLNAFKRTAVRSPLRLFHEISSAGIPVGLEPLDDIGDILVAEAELVGREHEGAVHLVAAFDHVLRYVLGDATGGTDLHRVALGKNKSVVPLTFRRFS